MEEVQFLLLLVTVLTQTLLALVRSHLVTLMLLSVWHSCNDLYGLSYLIFDANDFAGLNAGMLCAGIVIVVFFEMLRATFSARFLMMNEP